MFETIFSILIKPGEIEMIDLDLNWLQDPCVTHAPPRISYQPRDVSFYPQWPSPTCLE